MKAYVRDPETDELVPAVTAARASRGTRPRLRARTGPGQDEATNCSGESTADDAFDATPDVRCRARPHVGRTLVFFAVPLTVVAIVGIATTGGPAKVAPVAPAKPSTNVSTNTSAPTTGASRRPPVRGH